MTVDVWPPCADPEPGTRDGGCSLKRGHPGRHRSDSGVWGDDARRIEDYEAARLADLDGRARIRQAVANVNVNYVGQEGRGGAKGVRDEVLRILEREWGA